MQEENVSGEPLEAAAPAQVNEQEAKEAEAEKVVPLDALEAERAQRQKLADELQMIKDHFALLKSQQESQKQPKKSEFEGLSDDDVLTVGEFKKALQSKDQQYQMSMEELRVMQQNPDYQEVVTKYLPEVLKSNPELRRSLETTQDYQLAYHLAKNSDQYRQAHSQPAQKSKEAQKIIENANRAGSLSSAGAGTPVSEAMRYKDMSEDEFRRAVHKNMGLA